DEARASAAAARARERGEALGVGDSMRAEVEEQGRSAALASARAANRMRAGDFAGAVEDLQIVLRSTPTRPTVHERLAAAYERLGQRELAEKHRLEAQRLRAAR
ncbi:MAG: tetratricopeptide repeat protein, partial [Planctomycetota bacterium]